MTLDTPRKFAITSPLQTLNHPSTVPFPTSRAIISGHRDWGADALGKEELLDLPLLGKIWEVEKKKSDRKSMERMFVCLTTNMQTSCLWSKAKTKHAPSLPLREVQGPRVLMCRPQSSFGLDCFILFLLSLHFTTLKMVTWSLLWWLHQDTIEKKLFLPPLTPQERKFLLGHNVRNISGSWKHVTCSWCVETLILSSDISPSFLCSIRLRPALWGQSPSYRSSLEKDERPNWESQWSLCSELTVSSQTHALVNLMDM